MNDVLMNSSSTGATHRVSATQLAHDIAVWCRLYESMPVMLHSIDKHGKLVLVSDRWLETLGYTRSEVLGRPSTDFLTEDSVEKSRGVLSDFFERGFCTNVAYDMICKDGQIIHILLSATLERDAKGDPIRTLALLDNITAQRRAQESVDVLKDELAKQNELLQVTLRSIGEGVITTDTSQCITWLNPTAERLTQWPLSQAVGRPLGEVFKLINSRGMNVPNSVGLCLVKKEHIKSQSSLLLLSRTGIEYGIEESAAPILSDASDLLGSVLVFRDVTARRRLHQALKFRASHDALTGLFNRDETERALLRAMTQRQVDGVLCCLLFIDLDHFKRVNDVCGHVVGDRLLKQVSIMLKDTVPSDSIVGRFGGDEFVILLKGDTTNAMTYGTLICKTLKRLMFVHKTQQFRINASIGLVELVPELKTTHDVIQAADMACYHAKGCGRGHVRTWSSLQVRTCDSSIDWSSRLMQALEEDHFVLYQQPILSFGDPSRESREVLLRLEHDGQHMLPEIFLDEASKANLMPTIDQWVTRHVMNTLETRQHKKQLNQICINLSAQSVADETFHDDLGQLLAQWHLPTSLLCFELDEATVLGNMMQSTHLIQRIRAQGAMVSLDDFGTGTASFKYLESLDVDYLKIDGQFISEVVESGVARAMVRGFAEVANVLGIKTVAEFVETERTLDCVQSLGINFAQGYAVGYPAELTALWDE